MACSIEVCDSIPASLDNSTETVIPFDISNISPVYVHSIINKRFFETASTSLPTSPLPSSRKRFLCSSRIDDLDDDYFSISRRRKRNLSVIKNSVKNLRRKNKLLRQKNGLLEKKVSSLLDIIKDLKNKCMISENAAFNLEVCCI
ncbi:uncharacterized protein LOC126555349 [Aphis gossypii]|uniref:uncharacterized protein LOC126555349 n=1 Tax=Aphis gossypii TaxID=80765 RepID=UPI00215995B7|nr:uncharacterized protein LOC126555349 [Aphis gossypii]